MVTAPTVSQATSGWYVQGFKPGTKTLFYITNECTKACWCMTENDSYLCSVWSERGDADPGTA